MTKNQNVIIEIEDGINYFSSYRTNLIKFTSLSAISHTKKKLEGLIRESGNIAVRIEKLKQEKKKYLIKELTKLHKV
jgi:hypothetical protein